MLWQHRVRQNGLVLPLLLSPPQSGHEGLVLGAEAITVRVLQAANLRLEHLAGGEVVFGFWLRKGADFTKSRK